MNIIFSDLDFERADFESPIITATSNPPSTDPKPSSYKSSPTKTDSMLSF